MIAVGREQLALLAAVMAGAVSAGATAARGAGGGVEALDAVDQQLGGDVLALAAAGERGERHFGDLEIVDELHGLFVPHGVRIADRGPIVVADTDDRPPSTAKSRLRLRMAHKCK